MSQPTNQKAMSTTPELCTQCKQMFGHQTFNFMCSKCFNIQKNNDQLLEKKEKKENTPEVVRKYTEIEELQKVSKQIQKQFSSPLKKYQNRQPQEKGERERTRQKQQKKNINRCFTCNKKTGNLGHSCKHCENNYCKYHRLPQQHKCSVDFITAGKKLLIEANPQVKTRKLSQIE